jgi:hypothetical protein
MRRQSRPDPEGECRVSDLFEPDLLDSLLRQWSRSLRARNRSARTIETYTDTAEHLAHTPASMTMPTSTAR